MHITLMIKQGFIHGTMASNRFFDLFAACCESAQSLLIVGLRQTFSSN